MSDLTLEQQELLLSDKRFTEEVALSAAREELWRSETACSPSYMLRPSLSIDGNKWCALYGDNLQDGVAGFGDSPSAAFSDFDKKWVQRLKAT